MCSLDQCILDLDEENSEKPSAYSWEAENVLSGYSPRLVGWSGKTGECISTLEGQNIDQTQVLHVKGPKGSDYTGGRKSTPLGGHNSDLFRVSCGVHSPGVDKEVYELPAIEFLGVKIACSQGDAAELDSGVLGLISSSYGGNYLRSRETLVIWKGPSGSRRGIDVSGTNQLYLSSLSE